MLFLSSGAPWDVTRPATKLRRLFFQVAKQSKSITDTNTTALSIITNAQTTDISGFTSAVDAHWFPCKWDGTAPYSLSEILKRLILNLNDTIRQDVKCLSRVALAMRRRQQWFIHLRSCDLWMGDEYPLCSPCEPLCALFTFCMTEVELYGYRESAFVR